MLGNFFGHRHPGPEVADPNMFGVKTELGTKIAKPVEVPNEFSDKKGDGDEGENLENTKPSVEKREKTLDDILPKNQRLSVNEIAVQEASFSTRPFKQVNVVRYDRVQDMPINHRMEFATNNSVTVMIDQYGDAWATKTTPDLEDKLKGVGFAKGNIFVPFSNGEQPAGDDARKKWGEITLKAASARADQIMRENPGSEEARQDALRELVDAQTMVANNEEAFERDRLLRQRGGLN